MNSEGIDRGRLQIRHDDRTNRARDPTRRRPAASARRGSRPRRANDARATRSRLEPGVRTRPASVLTRATMMCGVVGRSRDSHVFGSSR
eukprot:3071-Pelagococcus_subviridis.AAC.4